MVTSLVALVPAELVVGPASALLRFQLAALGTVGEGLAEAVRAGTSQVDPAVLATLAGMSAVVVASFLVAGVVGLAAAVARSPRRPA